MTTVGPDPATGSKAQLYEAFAVSGKALGHGTRLQLLDLLAQGERRVEPLAAAVGLNLTTASAHLQALKRAGLVRTRRDGTRIYYRLAGDDVARLLVLLRRVAHAHQSSVPPASAAYLGSEPGEVMTREELRRRAECGDVLVLDVRPAEEYDAGHIPGAVSIPVGELTERLEQVPDDVDVVAYCRGEYCVMAHDAVRMLLESGRRAVRLHDGMLEWRLADLPVAVPAHA